MIRTVGFVGLGVMGRPMALNLIKGGYALRVYGRRPETTAPLAAAGATVCPSPAEMARGCDVIFSMVTQSQDSLAIIIGEGGIIAGARRGAIVVDMATIAPGVTRMIAARLAAAGIEALDAPVSGGGTGAASATLSIMVGGKPEVFAALRPLFACLGKSIVHIGPNGAGHVAKLCNQIVMLTTLQGLVEAVLYARKTGLDTEKLYESLAAGSAACRIREGLGRRIVDGDYAPGIEARLHYKDLQIALEEAHTLGLALPGAALVTQTFNALIGRGGGRQDSSQLIAVLEAACAPGSAKPVDKP